MREAPSWRMLKLGESEVFVRPTILVMAGLLILIFGPQFSRLHDGNGFVLAGLFVIVLYASILLHEFGHLLVARAFGFRVPTIELHLMGGHTIVEGRSKYALQEFLIAVIGPLISAAIGTTLLIGHSWVPGLWSTLFWSAGSINLFLAVFNALPSAPLDGGRMVKALAWGLTRSELTGITVASYTGRATAIIMVIGAPFMASFQDRFDFVRVAIIWFLAVFMWRSSGLMKTYDTRMARIASLDARSLMGHIPVTPDTVRISADLSGTALLQAMAENPTHVYALVDHTGKPIGSLLAEDVDRAYLEAK